MFNKSNLFKYGVIFLIFCVLTFTIGKMISFFINLSNEAAITVEVKSEEIDSGIRLETETKEANTFTSVVTLPFFKVKSIDQQMNDWALKQEDAFFQEMEKSELLLNEQMKAHFHLESALKKVGKKLYSIEMNIDQFIEQGNTFSTKKTFTIDTEKETMVELDDLFTWDDTLQHIIISHIIKSVRKEQEKIDDSLIKERIKDSGNLEWTILKDQFIIFFNPNEIGNHNHLITTTISLKHIFDQIKEEYKDKIVSKELAAEMKRINKAREEKEKQNKKVVALTFDDGPNETVTPRILDILNKHDAKATFFMLSKNVHQYPDIAKEVANNGHEIANHSMTHANLNVVNNKRIDAEIIDSKKVIEDITGITPTLYRPPYGEFNQKVLKTANNTDQKVILWSVDTLDWKNRNAKSIYENMKLQVTSGSIVLMHDIHETTADALPKMLTYLSDEGYEFVTVSEILPKIQAEGVGPHYGRVKNQP